MTIRARDARHAALAAALTDLSTAKATARLLEREIAIDWPRSIETTPAGIALVRTAVNLIVRFCPSVRLLPDTDLAASVAVLLSAIDTTAAPGRPPSWDALQVHLGGGAAADVTASARGWLAYVSGYGEALPALDGDAGVGVFGAAALGACQVFARALPLDERRAGASPTTALSFFDYRVGGRSPALPAKPKLAAALQGGAGAVGQASVDVLVGTGTAGDLTVVDDGRVDDPSNLNRSVLATEADLRALAEKVSLTERRAAGSDLRVEGVPRRIEEVVADVEAGLRPYPQLVLSAVDNREARWALQDLWPDLVLEGATGDTMAQVFRHAQGRPTACLRCLHPADTGDAHESYLARMAAATGLDVERIAQGLADPGMRIEATDVVAADGASRELLAENVGRDMCGFLVDAERLLTTAGPAPLLSVAFTSYLAGTFLAGEAIKAAVGLRTSLVGRFQIDPLATLDPPPPFVQAPAPECYCQRRRRVVQAIRRRALGGRA